MDVQNFLEFFIKELEGNRDLQTYYHLLNSKHRFLWRKAYLEQRLTYVDSHLGTTSGKIWDAGCGYGTTAIFLALKGYEVLGNTLEFYYDKINPRLDFWSKYGNLDKLKFEYADLYDMPDSDSRYNAIIAQDTLHHLEPAKDAVGIFYRSLKQDGRLIVAEENGGNVFICLKNFRKRGFKRTIAYYDERLKKNIVMGNENAQSLQKWKQLMKVCGLTLLDFEYIRFLPPVFFNNRNYQRIIGWEKQTGKKTTLLREILFFGINFTAVKPT